MTEPRGKGWIQPTRVGVASKHALLGASQRPASMTLGVPLIKDQTKFQACTGFGLIQCAHIYLMARGIPHTLWSAFFAYWFARREGLQKDTDVVDGGADPFFVVDAAADFGTCSWDTWAPTTLEQVNQRPVDVAIIEAQAHRLKLGVIFERGPALVESVLDALAAKLPLIIAGPVDAAYERNDGPTVIGPITGSSLGNHARCVYGYDPSGVFEAGSWSPSWRNGGCAVLSLEHVERSLIWAATVEVET